MKLFGRKLPRTVFKKRVGKCVKIANSDFTDLLNDILVAYSSLSNKRKVL